MSKDQQVTIIPPVNNSTDVVRSEQSTRFFELGLQGAPNTVRAYRSDLACYSRWCKQQDVAPFPASPQQVANYLAEIAAHYKVATLQRRLAMLSTLHQWQGLESPSGHQTVRTTLKGIIREKGLAQKMAPAFTLEEYRSVIKSLDEGNVKAFRDKVLLLLGFTGAFRREELIALNLEDLVFDERGILITLKHSKTDQQGKGQLKGIFYAADFQLCPVRTLQRWIKLLDRTTGPLLVQVRKNDKLTEKRLQGRRVHFITRHHLGIRYSAHSLRASFVTVARRNGADHAQIMQQTGHKTDAMVRRYTRFEDVRENNAGTKLGL